MKQATNKTTITTLNKGIAIILFLSQPLTSCSGEAGAIAPEVIPGICYRRIITTPASGSGTLFAPDPELE